MSLENVDVVILCGGMGKRLRAAIGENQKVMAAINDRPFLDILIEYLMRQGFKRFILCTGFQSDKIEAYYKDKKLDAVIEISKEQTPLGTGGAIKNAKSKVLSSTFFALNGDCFCAIDYANFLKEHRRKKACATLSVTRMKDTSDYGTIELDDSNRILAFKEKRPGTNGFVNVGAYCFEKSVFEKMPTQAAFSIELDFFPLLTKDNMFGFLVEDAFLDIGTPERYGGADQWLKNK